MPPRPRLTHTYTVVMLELSPAAYDEIKEKLTAAEYQHTFMEGRATDHPTIDMSGIGLVRGEEPKTAMVNNTPSEDQDDRIQRACAYINEATTAAERRDRKVEMWSTLYGTPIEKAVGDPRKACSCGDFPDFPCPRHGMINQESQR